MTWRLIWPWLIGTILNGIVGIVWIGFILAFQDCLIRCDPSWTSILLLGSFWSGLFIIGALVIGIFFTHDWLHKQHAVPNIQALSILVMPISWVLFAPLMRSYWYAAVPLFVWGHVCGLVTWIGLRGAVRM